MWLGLLLTCGPVEEPRWNNIGSLKSTAVWDAEADLYGPAHMKLRGSWEKLHTDSRNGTQLHTDVSLRNRGGKAEENALTKLNIHEKKTFDWLVPV